MSDYEAAKKAAARIMEKMRRVEGMAVPGTHDHWQFVSAGLMQEWARIRFVLETIVKN